MTPKFQTSIWGHPSFEKLSPKQKLCIIWLLTNPQINAAGIIAFSFHQFVKESGCTLPDLNDALKTYPGSFVMPPEGLMREKSSYIFVKNFIRYQFATKGGEFDRAKFRKNNSFAQVMNAAKPFWKTWLWAAMAKSYPEFFDADGIPDSRAKPARIEPKAAEKTDDEVVLDDATKWEMTHGFLPFPDVEPPIPMDLKKAIKRERTLTFDGDYSPGFQEFWKEYPPRMGVRNGKRTAWKSWVQKGCEPHQKQVIEKVKQMRETDGWRREDGRFIPMPSTFLNQCRWEDEVVESATAKKLSKATSADEPLGWKKVLVAIASEMGDPDKEERILEWKEHPWYAIPEYLKSDIRGRLSK